ncbi:MAG: sulfatase-like hydrolase/transferase, partial [Promethearchaeota archaeon]
MEQPNIIFIFSDQQRFDTLGCYGQELNITPNLDKLAKEGVLFEYAFTNQPLCGPARAILQTGLYSTETSCYRNGISLPISDKNIANYFSKNGYDVAYIGKWHLASNIGRSKDLKLKKMNYMTKPIPFELRGGYKDYWLASDLLEFTSHAYEGHLFDGNMNKVEFQGYRVDCLTDFALKYLTLRNRVKPFFLFLSFLEPHQQNDLNIFQGPDGSKEYFKNYKVPGDLENTEGDWRENFPDYLGCCNSIDKNVIRILEKLRELDLEENTIIFYCSDHGCHFRTRTWEYKRDCHESSVRIPLIIKGPGFEGGKKITELVSLIDIPPTLVKCAGIKVPNYMKGRPLQDLVGDPVKNWPEEIFIQISETQVGRAIRTKEWKYSVKVLNKDGILYSQADTYEEEYLYDLENDPYEKNNLVKDPNYSKIRAELSNILKRKMVEAGE